ncbi:MAG: hypothetical protein M9933_12230 [Chitinophagaceae bacterium]|nr:hypothetical protein [Chitinophagaceae bacterium]
MNWQKELYNHKISPPGEVWEKIEHDLDNEFLVFRHKLLFNEVAPPDHSWSRIAIALDTQKETRISAFKKWLGVGVAAALLGISFFTVNYFITEKSNTGASSGNPDTAQLPVHKENHQSTKKEEARGGIHQKPDVTAAIPLIASDYQPKRNIQPAATTTGEPEIVTREETEHHFSISSVPPDPTPVSDRYRIESTTDRKIRNLKGEIKEDVSLLDLPNSYFYITGPNGESVRVSAKFRHTIQYLNGNETEEMLDVILRESRYWRNQFKTWKEKVGHSSFVPTSQNFMDIAELMKLLQEHNHQ